MSNTHSAKATLVPRWHRQDRPQSSGTAHEAWHFHKDRFPLWRAAFRLGRSGYLEACAQRRGRRVHHSLPGSSSAWGTPAIQSFSERAIENGGDGWCCFLAGARKRRSVPSKS